jgi:hypothetical protein
MQTHDYAKCIEISKRVRWDINKDVIRGRAFDFSKKFLRLILLRDRDRALPSTSHSEEGKIMRTDDKTIKRGRLVAFGAMLTMLVLLMGGRHPMPRHRPIT